MITVNLILELCIYCTIHLIKQTTDSYFRNRRGTASDCKRNGRGFYSYSEKWIIEYFFISRSGGYTKSGVEFHQSKRNILKIWRTVLILGSLCLSCYKRNTASN